MIRTTVCALALIAVPAIAFAQASPADIVAHHGKAFGAGDLDGVMSDYADDAVVVTPQGTTVGKAAIRGVFGGMIKPPAAAGAAPAGGPPPLKMEPAVVTGNTARVSWTMNAGQPNAAHGADVFIIRDGKIAVQVVFLPGPPPAAQ